MIRIDTTDVMRLSADISKLPVAVALGARSVVAKVCADTERDAKAGAPVDTGNLRASIGRDLMFGSGSIAGEVGPTAEYGAYVEYGTSVMGPQPYMGPAFDRHSAAFTEALAAMRGGDL